MLIKKRPFFTFVTLIPQGVVSQFGMLFLGQGVSVTFPEFCKEEFGKIYCVWPATSQKYENSQC